jgi:hypothetical protein
MARILVCLNFHASLVVLAIRTRQPELFAEVGNPTGQGAGLADDDGRSMLGKQFGVVVAVGNPRLDAGAGRVAGIDTGDGLVFAQVDVENEAGGRGGEVRSGSSWQALVGVRGAGRP